MTQTALILIFSLTFFFITYYRLNLGLFFLFLLLPSYLIRFTIGPLPTTILEVMIWIILIVWLIQLTTNNQERSKKISPLISTYLHLSQHIKQHKTLFIASSIFLLAATISIFTSIDIRSALGEWKAFYIEPFLIFLVLITTIKKDSTLTHQHINIIIFALILSALATSLLATYQHFTGWMVPWDFWENRNTFRVTGWWGFPNGVGLFLAPIVPLTIYLAGQNWNALKKKGNHISHITYHISFVCSLLTVPCSLLAIVYGKSTGALVGVAAGIGLLLLFNKKTRWPAIIIGILGLLSIFSFSSLSPIKQELTMQDLSGQIRIDMWGEAVQFLSEHPITGAGLASYQKLIWPYRIDKWIEVFEHPHNIFLTMWVNLGLLGLFGFVWILVWFFRVGLSRITYHVSHTTSLTKFLISAMTVIIITGLVDSPYIKNDSAIMFWFLIALMVINIKTKSVKSV